MTLEPDQHAQDQEQAQARYRRDAQRLEARFPGLEAVPDAIVLVDSSGRIVMVNAECERLFGYTREELLGRSVEILVPDRFPDHGAQRAAYFAAPRTRPMGIGMELAARRHDGTEFPVEISLSPMTIDGASVAVAAVRDISERRRLEEARREVARRRAAEEALARHAEELARSNADLEQFAYVASHDLQEPLRMIANFTQLLEKRYRGRLDTDADEFIGYVVDGVDRMRQLISDLLTFSRVGTRGAGFQAVDTDLALGHVLTDLRVAIESSGATITHEKLPSVFADETQVGQLLQNLIGNAIKFRGAEPPRIHVAAERTGRDWTFSVRDNGIGVAPEHADRIFLVFQRLHTAAEYPGTGIGLAVCKKIVERHGGRIWVESRPDDGAVFHFTLPALPETTGQSLARS